MASLADIAMFKKARENALAEAAMHQGMTHYGSSSQIGQQGQEAINYYNTSHGLSEAPLEGGLDLGKVGGVTVNATDLLGTGLESKLAALAIGKLGSLGMVGATAWHGSPHLFDKFKNEAIGTGEGAQAYGHGLYLAEAKSTGEWYRDQLEQPTVTHALSMLQDGKEPILNNKNSNAGKVLDEFNGDGSRYSTKSGDSLDDVISSMGGKKSFKHTTDGFDVYDLGDGSLIADSGNGWYPISEPIPGTLYKTDIPDSHIDKMLDWDKPLSEQHPDVQAAWSNFLASPKGIAYAKDLGGASNLTRSASGGELTGESMIKNIMGAHEADPNYRQAASDYFASQGIPGIKYLDGSSRTAGEGTRNFVMFNPDDIRILERNGVPTGQQPWADDLVSKFKAGQGK